MGMVVTCTVYTVGNVVTYLGRHITILSNTDIKEIGSSQKCDRLL